MLKLKALAVEKSNPVQPLIATEEGGSISSTENVFAYRRAYEQLEVVHRGVDFVVDACAQVPLKVGERWNRSSADALGRVAADAKNRKAEGVSRLLNVEPNPYEDISSFRRKVFMDLIRDGNAFIYYDGRFLYHLPAENVTIVPDEKHYVAGYDYSGFTKRLGPDQVIHIRENSQASNYRGTSRLKSSNRAINTLMYMRDFQDNFFKNNAIPGLIISSPDTLSDKVKERILAAWQARFNPRSGGRRPLLLDGGFKVDKLSTESFKEMDFAASVVEMEDRILTNIGVPPILLKGGNNNNIRPNHRLFYIETVTPLLRKYVRAVERFFGFHIEEDVTKIAGMQPELRELAQYATSITNGGLITPNEGRAVLGYANLSPEQGEGDVVRVPANIAGSAADPSDGGRPPNPEDE